MSTATTDPRDLAFEHPALAAVAVRAGTATGTQRDQLRAALAEDDARRAQATGGAPAPVPAAGPAPAPSAAAGAPEPEAGPTSVPAIAGAAAAEHDETVRVIYEPSVYGEASSHSLVRDAFRARMDGDAEASSRVARFQSEVRHLQQAVNNSRTASAAVAVRAGFGEVIPPGYRGDLLVSVIDRGRPLVSRMGGFPLTDATPFRIPVEGEFDGIGEHTEGTAHRGEGTYDLNEVTVSPTAVSGAFRISREMVDASNPALDTLVISAMARDYRYKSEAKLVAQLESVRPVATPAAGGAAVESAMIDFLDDREDAPAFLGTGREAFKGLSAEVAGDGRKRYPYLNPANASGTSSAGFRGLDIQGLSAVRASAVDAPDVWLINPEDVLWGESSVLTFRFDEVEGPGVIKLALWAYSVAKVVRPAGVKRLAYTAPA